MGTALDTDNDVLSDPTWLVEARPHPPTHEELSDFSLIGDAAAGATPVRDITAMAILGGLDDAFVLPSLDHGQDAQPPALPMSDDARQSLIEGGRLLVLPPLAETDLAATDEAGPLVLPGVMDDDFVTAKFDDGPLVWPGIPDRSGVLNYGNAFDLRINEQGEVFDVHHPLPGMPHHDDWLF